MDFCNEFISALQTSPALTKTISIQDYLPKAVMVPDNVKNNLPYVQAYGTIGANYPYFYEISGLDSYCLIYTENGAGALTINDHSNTLLPNTLAIIDCKQYHRLEIKQSPWNYIAFFLNGASLSFLYRKLTDTAGNLHTFSLGSDIPGIIKRLYAQLDKNPDRCFLHARMIHDILLDLVQEISRSEESNDPIPAYLVEIKYNFDVNYQSSYSLDTFEHQYHISKYRICREFTKSFDVSPIQYLNQKRIEAAKEALRISDKRINEIGRMVGFDNTNHFIKLFKQQTGVTPLIFRKQPPV